MSSWIAFARGLAVHPAEAADLPFAWLEAPLAARLARTAEVADWQDLDRWPLGRLFGPQGEYRWKRQADGRLHAVVLIDGGPLPAGFSTPLELRRAGGTRERLLWGEWVDPAADPAGNPDGGAWFYAPEIPAPQRYPVELGETPHAGKHVTLVVQRYRERGGSTDPALRGGEHERLVGVRLVPPTAAKEEADG